MVMRASRSLSALLIFLVTLIVYVRSEVASGSDTIWTFYVAMSIIQEGNTNLDEYAHLTPPDDYRLERIGNNIYSRFPIGAPLIAVPFVLAYDYLLELVEGSSFSAYLNQHKPDQTILKLGKMLASIITASSVVVVYATALRFTSIARAALLALVYAFATSAWSTASRGMWQHGPSMLALSIALYLIVLSSDRIQLAQFAAIPLAFAFIIRPTNSISLLVFSIYILLIAKRYFVRYAIWLSLILVPFLLYNFAIYGAILSPYYLPERLGITPTFFEAFVGNLVSPSRGLFVFSPVLLFSIYGMVDRLKQASWRRLDPYVMIVIVLHWISISMFRHWYGGWSIGPRFLSDMLPLFAYFLAPFFARPPNFKYILNRHTLVFWFLLAVSIAIHFRCATSWAPLAWNNTPNNIDNNRHRLWDWSDLQFLRGLCPEPGYQAPICWIGTESPESRIPQAHRAIRGGNEKIRIIGAASTCAATFGSALALIAGARAPLRYRIRPGSTI